MDDASKVHNSQHSAALVNPSGQPRRRTPRSSHQVWTAARAIVNNFRAKMKRETGQRTKRTSITPAITMQ